MILPSRDYTEAVSGAGLLRRCRVGVGQRVCKAVSKSSGGGDFRTSADSPREKRACFWVPAGDDCTFTFW